MMLASHVSASSSVATLLLVQGPVTAPGKPAEVGLSGLLPSLWETWVDFTIPLFTLLSPSGRLWSQPEN